MTDPPSTTIVWPVIKSLSADDRKSSAPIKSSGAASRLMARVATFAARRVYMTPPGAGASMVRGRTRSSISSHHENDGPEGTRPFQKHDPERDIPDGAVNKESLGEDHAFSSPKA
jgi:hypothetical protein